MTITRELSKTKGPNLHRNHRLRRWTLILQQRTRSFRLFAERRCTSSHFSFESVPHASMIWVLQGS